MDIYTIAYPMLVQCFMVICCFLMFVISNKKNDYFRVGPSNNLTIINIDIHNPTLYFSSLAVIGIMRFVLIIQRRITLNFINNNIFNLKIKDRYVNNFTSLVYFIESITQMLLLKIYVTQIDYAIFSIIISECLFIPINYLYMKKCTHLHHVPRRVLDVTTINPLF